jgi:hypothetical protein
MGNEIDNIPDYEIRCIDDYVLTKLTIVHFDYLLGWRYQKSSDWSLEPFLRPYSWQR